MLSLVIGMCAAAVSLVYWANPPQPYPSDFSIVWAGARGLLSGQNPYDLVGPGKAHGFPYPLLYPLPAILVAAPFALLPLHVVDPLFVALSACAFVWAITRYTLQTPALLACASIAFIAAVQVSQWSPLLVAAALTPSLGFLLACKPTIGAALWIAYPSWRSAVGAATMVALSFMIWPGWFAVWRETLTDTRHMVAPVMRWGGPLLLLALAKWRTHEGRLLAALACVPQTPLLYEAVPLFLIPRTLLEGITLLVGTTAVLTIRDIWAPGDYEQSLAFTGHWMVYLIYLPCLVMILRRPNSRPAADSVNREP